MAKLSVSRVFSELGRYGFSYRQDWADKLGLGTPETIQDVYDMLYAFHL